MKIHNTMDASLKPSVLMLVYGQGGVGKTTFTATAPQPIIADCENGSKYFGLRGIKVDVATIEKWKDIQEFYTLVKESNYETIIVDPIGELMEKLKNHIVDSKEKKWVQYDGSLTMAGWGEMKDRMRKFVKSIRDLNKHMILVAHMEEKDDDGKLVKRPKIVTKLSEELIALVDVVGYMEVVKSSNQTTGESEEKRIIRVQPSERYESKDRTGQLGAIIEPDFSKIINACQGNEVYSWSSVKAKKTTKDVATGQQEKTPVEETQPDDSEPTEEEVVEATETGKVDGEAFNDAQVATSRESAKSKLAGALGEGNK